MKLFAFIRSLAFSWFQRSRMRREIVNWEMDEELLSHIQSRADDLERSGLPRFQAERRHASSSAATSATRRNAAKPAAAVSATHFSRTYASASE